MKLKTIEFEMDGFDIIATAEYNEISGLVQDISYDIKSSDDDLLPAIDGEMHDTIMDYAYYLLKDEDFSRELDFG